MVNFTFEYSKYILRNTYKKGNAVTVRTESDGKLIVYGGNHRKRSTDTFLVLHRQQDLPQKPYKYIAASYFSRHAQHNLFIAVIAQYNSTQLSIAPSMDTTIGGTCTLSGTNTNSSLQTGETFPIQN